MSRSQIYIAFMLIGMIVLTFATPKVENSKLAQYQFKQFVTTYNKSYSAKEFQIRFLIFQDNLKKIEELNAKQSTAKFAVNKFADLTAAEFRKYYSGTNMVRNPEWPMLPTLPEEIVSNIPTSWDWVGKGAVTGVKDQGSCGSCWAFSTTGNVEGQWFLAGNKLIGLSEQNLVDCDHECMSYEGEESCDAGCDGGLMPNAFTYIIKNGGIDTEAAYPYVGETDSCQQVNKSLTAHITNWTMIPSDETQMAAYLVAIGPMSVAVDAEEWQFYFGGVLQLGSFCGTSLDHGVLIVGYGNETNIFDMTVDFWNIKNSWGADWGENGYIRIERGDDECGVDLFPCTSLVGKKRY